MSTQNRFIPIDNDAWMFNPNQESVPMAEVVVDGETIRYASDGLLWYRLEQDVWRLVDEQSVPGSAKIIF